MRKKKDEPMEVMPEQQMVYGLKTGGGLKGKSEDKPKALAMRPSASNIHILSFLPPLDYRSTVECSIRSLCDVRIHFHSDAI
jgi:hypothetical protein